MPGDKQNNMCEIRIFYLVYNPQRKRLTGRYALTHLGRYLLLHMHGKYVLLEHAKLCYRFFLTTLHILTDVCLSTTIYDSE